MLLFPDSLYAPYILADYYHILEQLAVAIAAAILLSSLDDLIIDAWYWIRRMYRWITITGKATFHPLTEAQLREKAEQPIAIMIPAWLEYNVIGTMLENLFTSIDYKNYVVFVGTYVNDPKTITAVTKMQRRYKHLQQVEVPHPGPTNKADCLNWISNGIIQYEKKNDMEFSCIVIHDCEDVLHALELLLFNYLTPRKDMIQLPVISLQRKWYELVAGVYMDEFAECHGKDLVVRESMMHLVPSAGVGTCFSRRSIRQLCRETNNQPFNTSILTEDYFIAERLNELGMQSIFVRFPVQYRIQRPALFRKPKQKLLKIPLCVREFFPNTFRTAYRQRARWMLGICFQAWEQIGWRGSLVKKYFLFRDRKAMVTASISIAGYIVFSQITLYYLVSKLKLFTTFYPSIFVQYAWPRYLIYANLAAFAWRIAQRFYFVGILYGWLQATLSIPRIVISNLVNFMASMRAWKMFLRYLFFNEPLVWDKTMHDFPSAKALGRQRKQLGDLLTIWQVIDSSKLEEALQEQHHHKLPLGRILIAKGWLDDETLAEAIAFQSEIPRLTLTEAMVMNHAGRLDIASCIKWRVLVAGVGADDRPLLATANPVRPDVLVEITSRLGVPPVQRIVRENEIATGLRLLRGDETAFSSVSDTSYHVPLLGDLLIESNYVNRDVFDAALRDYQPEKHGRIGEYLVREEVISQDILNAVVAKQTMLRMEADGGRDG